jgi:hypothetical protein
MNETERRKWAVVRNTAFNGAGGQEAYFIYLFIYLLWRVPGSATPSGKDRLLKPKR